MHAELAPPGIRGSLVALQQLAITFGIFISYWIGYGTSFMAGTGAWRIPLAIQLVPAIILCVGAFFLPFSPRWLMLQGRQEESLLTLANLRNMEPENILIQAEHMALQAERLVEMEEAKERYGTDKPGWGVSFKEYMRLLTTWSLLHRLLIAASSQGLQQWSGINAVIYYAPTIFQQIGLRGNSISLLATGIVGVVNLVMTIPAVLYVDNLGRKPVMFWGATSMAISHATIGAIIAVYGGNGFQNKAAGELPPKMHF